MVLSETLQEGKTLSQTLPLAAPEICACDVAAIAAAEESDNLLAALKRLLTARSVWDFSNELNIGYGIYLLLVVVTAVLALIIHSIYVRPLFSYFYPPIRRYPLWLWYFYNENLDYFNNSVALLPSIIFLVILIASVILLSRFLFPNVNRARIFRWLRDMLGWYTPFLGAIVRWHTWANVAAILHEFALVGEDLPSAVESAANSGINSVAHWRLQRWKMKMQQGHSPKAAALAAGLPKLLCSNLDETTGSTFAGSLGFVHAIYQRRFEQSVALVHGATIPTVVIFLGIIVLMTMLLLFMPYVSLLRVIGT